MKAFGRLVKPLTFTTLAIGTGLGGYYWYNAYQVKDLDNNAQKLSIFGLEAVISDLAQLLNYQNPGINTQGQSEIKEEEPKIIEKQ